MRPRVRVATRRALVATSAEAGIRSVVHRLTHTVVCNILVCMNVDRLSITLDPRLGAAARKAAKRAKVSLSTWIADATADRVRNELLGEALDRWEAEGGALTQKELDQAAEALGLSRRRKARRA
jgi:hypothetical protein